METPLSTWLTNFAAHAFHGSWERLVRTAESEGLIENISGTQLADILRLRKAISFLSGLIESLDPELVPRSTWAKCQSHVESINNQLTAYASSRNEGNLIAANENVDVLLESLTRFGSEDAKRRGALVTTRRVDDQITQIMKRVLDAAKALQIEMTASRSAASEELAAIREARTRAANYSSKLMDGTDADPSIKSRIDSFLAEASRSTQEIRSFHTSLIVGSTTEESTQAQIKAAAKKVTEAQAETAAMLAEMIDKIKNLSSFHTKIFGDGRSEVGLKGELEARLKELSEYEATQKLRYQTLSDQVEDLLPGAASAGLASSFRAMREQFTAPIATYTKIFYASIALMLAVALGSSVESVSFQPFSWTLARSSEWNDTLRRLLERLPVLLPLVWLAVFSATRRSQYERLQQEYAHKQALASSYESYRRQVTALGDDTVALLKELMARAIETVAFNASATLDGKHEQKPPLQSVLEKFSPTEIDKLVELIRGKKS